MSLLDNSYAAFINLDIRTDRLKHMQRELDRVGIDAVRFKALLPGDCTSDKDRIMTMYKRTPGAIGCMFSQIEVMAQAFNKGKHAFVMEDDLIFCDDIHARLAIMEESIDEWDILWLGGTYHLEPTWHKRGHNQLPQCTCDLNRDWERTSNPHIVRTYGIWSTYAYIVNHGSITKVLSFLNDHMAESIGIDYTMIHLQPTIKSYAFNPGCVKQIDNKSNIGKGQTTFSNFSKLGGHWFSSKM